MSNNPFDNLEERLASIEALLKKVLSEISNIKSNSEISDTIGIEEVSKILHLSVDTIYYKTHKKLIPHFKKGKKLLFSKKIIMEYIAEGEVKTLYNEIRDSEKIISDKIKNRQSN